MNKAEECIALAKKQHVAADTQHDGAEKLAVAADKLDALGHALTDNAVEIKGIELESDENRRRAWRD